MIDLRFQNHGAGHGGTAFLARNGSAISTDIKEAVIEARTHTLLKLISKVAPDSAENESDINPDALHPETREMAKSMMDDETCNSVGRAALRRGRWTMQEQSYAAERDK